MPWTYGDPVNPDEYKALCERLALAANVRRRRAIPNPARVLAALHALVPMRLEHEMNRLRGLAFDAGEAGFSFTRIEEGTT